jgi:HEAT repeat protein
VGGRAPDAAAARERGGHADPRVRAAVAGLLAQTGGEGAVAVLERVLADDHPAVRAAAASAVGRLGHWPAGGLDIPEAA